MPQYITSRYNQDDGAILIYADAIVSGSASPARTAAAVSVKALSRRQLEACLALAERAAEELVRELNERYGSPNE